MLQYKKYEIKKKRLAHSAKNLFMLIFFGLVFQIPLLSQGLPANTTPSAAPSPLLSPTPIPFSEIISQTETDISKLKEIATSASTNQNIVIIEQDLPSLIDEINARLDETTKLTANRPTIEKLRELETDWNGIVGKLQNFKDKLAAEGKKLDNDQSQVIELDKKWKTAQKDFENNEVPPELTARIQSIFANINETRRQIETQQARVVRLQDKAVEQEKRVNEVVKSIRQTRENLVRQLFAQDSPPLWSSQLWLLSAGEIWRELVSIVNTQFQAANDFVRRNGSIFIIQLCVLIIFAGILFFLRRWVNPHVKEENSLQKAAVIFEHPVSTGLILTLFLTLSLYKQPPVLIDLISGMLIFISTILILRKLVEKNLYPVLYILAVFNLFDDLRRIFDSQILVSRLLFLGEMLGGAIFFIWLYRTHLKKSLIADAPQSGVFQTFRFALLIAAPILGLAFFANLIGFVELSHLLGNAVLKSAYISLIFYALVRIIDGLIIFSLRFRPLSLLKMVANHRDLIQKKARRFVRLIAFILWLIITLQLLSLNEWVFGVIKSVFTANIGFGSLNIEIGDIFIFVVTIWAAFALSRFVSFVLEEDVYSRFSFERGLPYAISTLLKYAILLLGFFLAVAGAGFDLSKFTILAGAFGVGIGFGLQNIINNFVSGLILLFERPVKVGDIVKIGDAAGIVKKIGIRASVIHVWDSSDVIVPNSKLIAENVTNWSFSSQRRGIEIIFSVPPETIPEKVIKVMEKAAANHPLVMEKPVPQVLFNEISFDRLTFKLRVWTEYFDKFLKIHSDLVLNISEALRAENIPHEKIIVEETKNN